MPRPKGSAKPAGSGRKRGSRNKRSEGIEHWARMAVERPEYRERLLVRMDSGELAPAVETMLFYYAYGRPVEHVEHTGANQGPITLLYGRHDPSSLV